MTTKDKLLLMKQTERRNNERWSITKKEQDSKQTAVEYSYRESMMSLYVR